MWRCTTPISGADAGGEGEGVAKLLNYLKDKLSDEDYAAAARLVQSEEAMDAEPEDEDDKKDKPAMDSAAVARMVAKAKADALAESAAIRTAEREVSPIVGELVAMDSAAAVYKVGLEALGVDTAKLPVAAYGETFRAVKIAREAAAPAIALDARASSIATAEFDKRFANRTNLIRG